MGMNIFGVTCQLHRQGRRKSFCTYIVEVFSEWRWAGDVGLYILSHVLKKRFHREPNPN
jgi:hypothetical protein